MLEVSVAPPNAQNPPNEAVHVDGGSGGLRDRVDHGGDILELARQVVVRRVPAGAAASTVHGVDGGVRLEVRQ
jgi:hypothetical protein